MKSEEIVVEINRLAMQKNRILTTEVISIMRSNQSILDNNGIAKPGQFGVLCLSFQRSYERYIEEVKVTQQRHDESAEWGLIVGGAGTAIFAPVALWSVASTMGVASTGTLISTLSGAAATSATLACLGGGAITSGGLGMTAGMAVIGGPVVLGAIVCGAVFCALDSKKGELMRVLVQMQETVRLLNGHILGVSRGQEYILRFNSGNWYYLMENMRNIQYELNRRPEN